MSSATPSPASPTLAKLVALAGVLLSCVYLANLTAGLFPEIPDNFPGVGNLDEVFFSGLLLVCLAKLGINVIPNLQATRPAPPQNLEGQK